MASDEPVRLCELLRCSILIRCCETGLLICPVRTVFPSSRRRAPRGQRNLAQAPRREFSQEIIADRYTRENIVGADFVSSYGGEIVRADLVPARSTSDLINRARA